MIHLSQRTFTVREESLYSCGQSYKQFMLVNYDPRVVLTRICLYYYSRVVIYERKLPYKIGHIHHWESITLQLVSSSTILDSTASIHVRDVRKKVEGRVST